MQTKNRTSRPWHKPVSKHCTRRLSSVLSEQTSHQLLSSVSAGPSELIRLCREAVVYSPLKFNAAVRWASSWAICACHPAFPWARCKWRRMAAAPTLLFVEKKMKYFIAVYAANLVFAIFILIKNGYLSVQISQSENTREMGLSIILSCECFLTKTYKNPDSYVSLNNYVNIK